MRAARNAAISAAVMYLCAMVSDTIVMRASGSTLLQGEGRAWNSCPTTFQSSESNALHFDV